MTGANRVHRSGDTSRSEFFGRYRLLRRLGVGGMAEVFLASPSSNPSDAPVALKRILPHLADDLAFVSRFKREAMISLKLEHPAIARVLDVGRVSRTWFIAMELVAGETMARAFDMERTSDHRMPVSIVRRVGADIAKALDFAHNLASSDGRPLQIVHRDVSPQNVMLSYNGCVKLIDFGVARWADSGTRTGGVAGKVRYFSPEQARGLVVDHRSDIYSLGVMLYEALLGRPVFRRDNEIATIHAILEEDPPPLDEGVPADLAAALRRAMSKAPEHRFQSANELAEVLLGGEGERSCLAAEPGDLVAYMAALFPADAARWRHILEFPHLGESFDPTSARDERESLAELSNTHPRTRPPEAVSSSFGRTVRLMPPVEPTGRGTHSSPMVRAKWPLFSAGFWSARSPRALAVASIASLATVTLVTSFVGGTPTGAARSDGHAVIAAAQPASPPSASVLANATSIADTSTGATVAAAPPASPVPRPAGTHAEGSRPAKQPARLRARSTFVHGRAPRHLGSPSLPAAHSQWSADSLADQLEPSPYTDKLR